MPKKVQERTITLHRTFDEENSGASIFHVAEKGKVKRLTGLATDAFLRSLTANDTVRLTSSSYFLGSLAEMQNKGIKVVTCHWHRTGIEKSLEPQEIALRFSELSDDLFNKIKLRSDIAELRVYVQQRLSLLKYRKGAYTALLATTRGLGFTGEDDPKLPPELKENFANLAEDAHLNENGTKDMPGPERKIVELAQKIPECVLFNKILNVGGSWMTAATVVAFLGDPGRFSGVQAMRHYCGYHVVDGHAAKRKKGEAQTWNGKIRTALWSWSTSMLKTRNPVWRPLYDEYLAAELEVHGKKHPKCTAIQGHCGARARMKVVQQVLKQFYVDAMGLPLDPPVKITEIKSIEPTKTRRLKKVA
jgi:hypothetical protein